MLSVNQFRANLKYHVDQAIDNHVAHSNPNNHQIKPYFNLTIEIKDKAVAKS